MINSEQPSIEVSEWTQFETLSDVMLKKIQNSTAPQELRQQWMDAIEDAEDLSELKENITEIQQKLDARLVLDSKKFNTPTEDKAFADAELTKAKITEVVEEALAGKYDQAGHGMTAEVYISNKYPDVCYKIITNSEEYKKGLNVKDEMSIQDSVSGLNVNGVRVPRPYSYNMNEDNHLCVMEHLNATTLQDVLIGEKRLPKNFDIDQKFSDLKEFFSIMHSKYGIYHRDFHDKNIMFDLDDGTIYIIDFGKAVKGFGTEDDIYRDSDGTVYPLTDEQQIDKHHVILRRFLKAQNILILDK